MLEDKIQHQRKKYHMGKHTEHYQHQQKQVIHLMVGIMEVQK